MDGRFVLGDLPPGRYTLQIDPTTVPQGYVAEPTAITVDVRCSETAAAKFLLSVPPKPVLQFDAPEQHLNVGSPAPRN
jgi:hypothetical protein